jgi:uncharacterized membrane protein
LKKNWFLLLVSILTVMGATAQGYTISHYQVAVIVNKDASLDITETINADFDESRHGIIRIIPYKYQLAPLPHGTEKANRQLESHGEAHTIIENIDVTGWDFSVSNRGDYKEIKIGSKDNYVIGQQQYIIHYRLLNAINFFADHSELYLNIIGDRWDTRIDSASFTITLYDALPSTPAFFVATGITGSHDNSTISTWYRNKLFSGNTCVPLQANQGLTAGIILPAGFLQQQDYMLRGRSWLLLPALILTLMFWTWKRWGKDQALTITTQYYPPENLSPSVAGYVIDDKLDKRDLTALIPYWGAGGYLQVRETEKKSLLGLIKTSEYEFIKLKSLPQTALLFEQTLFNGIFASGEKVALKSLAEVLYITMNTAKKELEDEVDKNAYYEKYSRGMVYLFLILGLALTVFGIFELINNWGDPYWLPVALISSGIITIGFGIFMTKKTQRGNELYQQLAGFKEFIQKVEKDRLAAFLKEDEHYFDKVLPFAIVFDVADTWKDKLKGLDIPPPTWYVGDYDGFNTSMFLGSLDHSMNQMTENFYSAPSNSSSSGSSWGGSSGGFSGGGFGGGGGSSW